MENKQIPVSHKDYMLLSDAYDKHSRNLMGLKGEEYSIDDDFLAMENRLAGMFGDTPEYVSLVMAGKHITALGIILLKNDVHKIKLEKFDERVRDAVNLLKIMAAFVHAKQNDFSLHLGKEEKYEHKEGCNPKPWETKCSCGLLPVGLENKEYEQFRAPDRLPIVTGYIPNERRSGPKDRRDPAEVGRRYRVMLVFHKGRRNMLPRRCGVKDRRSI
jgi:hypothetical protein